jgi:DNA-binding response OmpR family regulator
MVYRFADCDIDFKKMTVRRGGSPVVLTAHEFKLLKFFTENAERVLTRDVLLNEVWGYNFYPTTRTVDNQILKLRQKLEPDPANPKHLLTIYGAGYKFVP